MSSEQLTEIEQAFGYSHEEGAFTRESAQRVILNLLAELREVTRERDEARALAAKNEQDWREAREARWAFLERKIEAAELERDKLKVDLSYLQDEHRDLEHDYDALEQERDALRAENARYKAVAEAAWDCIHPSEDGLALDDPSDDQLYALEKALAALEGK